jgi:hypothetical protein
LDFENILTEYPLDPYALHMGYFLSLTIGRWFWMSSLVILRTFLLDILWIQMPYILWVTFSILRGTGTMGRLYWMSSLIILRIFCRNTLWIHTHGLLSVAYHRKIILNVVFGYFENILTEYPLGRYAGLLSLS